jgi:hypothetical protein
MDLDDLAGLKVQISQLESELDLSFKQQEQLRNEFLDFQQRTLISEYTSLLKGLSTAQAPDAFAFMSLMHLSVDDRVAIIALAEILENVPDLTVNHVEEIFSIYPRIQYGDARNILLNSVSSRLFSQLDKKTWIPTSGVMAAVALVYSKQGAPSELADLICHYATQYIGKWPIAHLAEIAAFVAVYESDNVSNFMQCLLGWLQANAYVDELAYPRVICSLLSAFRKFRISIPQNLSSQLTITAEKAVSRLSSYTAKVNHELHLLVCEMAHIRARGTGSLWLVLVDKLAHATPAAFEIPHTVSAILAMGYTHENIYSSNLPALKRFVSQPDTTLDNFIELLENISIMGEKSLVVIRTMYDRKDFIDTSPAAFWAFLAACAVVSAQGTSVSEGVVLYRKADSFETPGISSTSKLLIGLALSPNFVSQSIVQSSTEELEATVNEDSINLLPRIKGVMSLLGIAEHSYRSGFISEGILIDVAFPKDKVAIIFENNPLFSVTLRRFLVRGWTTLKLYNLNRRGWKVYPWIPELYSDEKSAAIYLMECLKRVPLSLEIFVKSSEDVKLIRPGQRSKSISVKGLSMVEVARCLLSILRNNLQTDFLDLADCGLTDFMTDVLDEFLITYIGKFSLNRVDLSRNSLTDSFLQRFLTALKQTPTNNRVIEVSMAGNLIDRQHLVLESFHPLRIFFGDAQNFQAIDGVTSVFLIGI